MLRTVHISLREARDASYDILVGAGLFAELPHLLAQHVAARRYAIIADSQVGRLYGARLVAALQEAKLPALLLTFPAGEWNKTRETWAALSDQMLAAHVGRDAAVIALGGGVVGDVAGFVAATYLRGIPFVQVPTSLLAMIDSSIGGKTGVDAPHGKNLIGAFYQPRLVAADPQLLATLPAVQLQAGLAEALKHAVIADAQYFDFLLDHAAAIRARDQAVLVECIARSVEIKAAVVAEDERETAGGRRAVLNFGHTIGHAVEVRAGFELLHGEAVAVGMRYEAELAEQLGVAAHGLASTIRRALETLGLPVQRPDTATIDEVWETMQLDKKVRAEAVRFALPERVGKMHCNPETGWTVAAPEALVRGVLAG